MFKKNIFSKLFFMNLIILILLVITQLMFQKFLFEPYYISKKESILKDEVNKFQEFIEEGKSSTEILEFIDELSRNEKIALVLKDSYLNDIVTMDYSMSKSNIELEDIEGKVYKIILENYSEDSMIKVGDNIDVLGVVNNLGYIYPSTLRVNGVSYDSIFNVVQAETNSGIVAPSLVLPAQSASEASLKNLDIRNAKVKKINVDNSYYFSQTNKIYEVFGSDLSLWNELLIGNDFTKKIYDNKNEYSNLLYGKNIGGVVVIGVTALSQVSEAIGVMNNYYIFIFLFSLVLVVGISFIYSKYISKPLIQMSNIANNIANCNFTDKYKVSSEDEIGMLGNSLNKISENLEEALGELKKANVKLKDDMDIQKVQEEKRKELIANISHEFKTPITIIQGYVNGIRNGMYNDEKYYNSILDETKRLDGLVKEMLDISRLESPSFKLNVQPFDLWGTFLKEYDKLRSILREKDINIDFDMDEAIVYGDEKRISQVIVNLYTNAIKYTPSGENIKVSIDLSDDKKYYVFNILNTGVKLDDDEIINIWDSFYRGEKSRNKKYGGTGLGLAIVKIILELHNSSFGVKNVENGVLFYFTLEICNEY
ncbi:HAMP domain-containing sensor histidine kinase [Clostridium sp.]|uniref:HAMP domain-containing sensor histidine kinase n=1 Tax=Clostridium sp. TaxID=1506 RepID=UPI003F66727B